FRVTARTQEAVRQSLGAYDFRARLKQTFPDGTAPRSLLVHGIYDPMPLESARETAALLSTGVIELATGHAPHVEATEAFVRVLRSACILEHAHCCSTSARHDKSALDLLVAISLSAQSTDARVNMVTAALFAKYGSARDFASADPAVLEQEIHGTGFFRNKTRSIVGMAQTLLERHGGEVPDAMDALVQLPGVGRKTANVVLGTWFRKNDGIVVDTHVQRLSTLLGLTREKHPVKIERDLMALVPRDKWTWFSHT